MLTENLFKNWRRFLQEGQQQPYGYKIVAYEDGKLFSLQNPDLKYNIKVGSIESPENGMFLGTSKSFVEEYYAGLTDKQDALLTYTYDLNHVIKGNANEEGEIKVASAKLISVDLLQAL